MKIWNNLSIDEKQYIKNKSMAYFPELFSNHNDKFSRFSVWLVTQEGIVCPNVRDLFTAGGRGTFGEIDNIPRIFINLFENVHFVKEILLESNANELSNYWRIKTTEKNKIPNWIELVSNYSNSILDISHLSINQIITDLFI